MYLPSSLRAPAFVAACVSILATVPAQIAPGFRVFGPLQGTSTLLVDTNGTIVQNWPSTFLPGGGAVYVVGDGSLLRSIATPGAPAIGGSAGGVQRLSLTGTVLWDFRYDGPAHWSHHDLAVLPNGNVLMIAWDVKTAAQAVTAGRASNLLMGPQVRVDSVIEVQPTGPTTGTIVWEWHVWDHLIQDNDVTQGNFGVVGAHPELVDFNFPPNPAQAKDWNHMNSVDYDAVHDWVIMGAHNQSEVWVIDHGTTTAQAAGHTGGSRGQGGDLLYRWGNPQAYRAGTSANQQLFGQHCDKLIRPGLSGAGNLLVFNNNYPGGSQVWELVLPLDLSGNFLPAAGGAFGPTGPIWSYSAAGFSSTNISSCERLPNGNTLICSGAQGWVFEVTSAGQQVWSYLLGTAIFQAHYVERLLWADKDALSGSAGGTVSFDLIAGSPQAGLGYLLLASASGTSPGIPANGFVLPLNLDDTLLFTIDHANTPLLTQTLGTLDALGRATASLNLPPGLVIGPAAGHFAFGVYDPVTFLVTAVSQPVPLTINP